MRPRRVRDRLQRSHRAGASSGPSSARGEEATDDSHVWGRALAAGAPLSGLPLHHAAQSLSAAAGNQAVQRAILHRHAAAEDPAFATAAGKVGALSAGAADIDNDESVVQRTPETDAPNGRSVQREVGIAKSATTKKYAKAAAAGIPKPDQTVSTEDYFESLRGPITSALQSHKVLAPPIEMKDAGAPERKGGFLPRDWAIVINKKGFADQLDPRGATRFAGILYHEARHAEQWYSLVRLALFRLRKQLGTVQIQSLRLTLPAPDHVLQNVMASTPEKKTGFSKGEKHRWASHLFDKSVTPAQGLSPAKLSDELLKGERAPSEAVPAFDATLEHKRLFDDPRKHQFPMPTDNWTVFGKGVASMAWQTLVGQGGPLLVAAGLADAGVVAPEEVANACSEGLVNMVPGLRALRDNYLTTYRGVLDEELRAADAAYEKAYATYKALPVEADAFAVQDVTEKYLDKYRKKR